MCGVEVHPIRIYCLSMVVGKGGAADEEDRLGVMRHLDQELDKAKNEFVNQ